MTQADCFAWLHLLWVSNSDVWSPAWIRTKGLNFKFFLVLIGTTPFYFILEITRTFNRSKGLSSDVVTYKGPHFYEMILNFMSFCELWVTLVGRSADCYWPDLLLGARASRIMRKVPQSDSSSSYSLNPVIFKIIILILFYPNNVMYEFFEDNYIKNDRYFQGNLEDFNLLNWRLCHRMPMWRMQWAHNWKEEQVISFSEVENSMTQLKRRKVGSLILKREWLMEG